MVKDTVKKSFYQEGGNFIKKDSNSKNGCEEL